MREEGNKKLEKPNLILITIDALRADHLGFMDYRKDISPNLDAFARESTVFTQAFATGPITPHSFPGILTSTYPLDYQGPGKIEKPRKLISEVLKAEGYITAAFHFNVFLSSYFGYDKGWDFFEDMGKSFPSSKKKKKNLFSFFHEPFKKICFSTFPGVYYWLRWLGIKYLKIAEREASPPIKLKLNAEFINRTIEDFIESVKNEKRPFFLWTHYLDVHAPYLPREYYFEKKPYSSIETLKDNLFPQHLKAPYDKKKALIRYMRRYLSKGIEYYDYGIEYWDYQFGKLINFLKNGNLYNSSIIIITSDHGEEFLEHNGGGHNPKLYNELLHVPLLIRVPGIRPKTINKKVSLIDIPPTICQLLGIKKPLSFKGNDLFEFSSDYLFHQTAINIDSRERYTNIDNITQCKTACQTDRWKYIVDYGTGSEELYDLTKDPKEQNNLASGELEITRKVRKIINKFLEENPPLCLLRK